jgi:hypothetical protein
LAGLDASAKESLDMPENLGDNFAELWIMRGNLQRRIHKHASFSLLIIQGPFNDLREKGADRL